MSSSRYDSRVSDADRRGGDSRRNGHPRRHDDNKNNDDDDDSEEERKRISSRRQRDRSRSRSRSPEARLGGYGGGPSSTTATASLSERDKFQQERQARMARLRQEIREEDKELTVSDHHPPNHNKDGGRGDDHPGHSGSGYSSSSFKNAAQQSIIQVNPDELEGLDEDEQMQRLLGFSGNFASTKGQAVEDNQTSAARGVASKHKARKYRQYMNRKNGFNRPLEKMG
jgi:U4/U6.U5 tri-snRNP-associated protein 3